MREREIDRVETRERDSVRRQSSESDCSDQLSAVNELNRIVEKPIKWQTSGKFRSGGGITPKYSCYNAFSTWTDWTRPSCLGHTSIPSGLSMVCEERVCWLFVSLLYLSKKSINKWTIQAYTQYSQKVFFNVPFLLTIPVYRMWLRYNQHRFSLTWKQEVHIWGCYDVH